LKSGLASAPGLDPESASSSGKGLRLDGLIILCWPAAVCGEESAVVQIVTKFSAADAPEFIHGEERRPPVSK
jgi:hypothetical protein